MVTLLVALLVVIVAHFVADYVFQVYNKKMAKKNEDIGALTLHVVTYGIVMAVFCAFIMPIYAAIAFAWVNAAIHGIIDLFTSAASHRLFKKWFVTGQSSAISNFFLVLGVDQTLHYLFLIGLLVAGWGQI